jgi:hypothetical protein
LTHPPHLPQVIAMSQVELQAPPGYRIQQQYGTTATGCPIWQASHRTKPHRALFLREAQLIAHRTAAQTDRIRTTTDQLTQLKHIAIPSIRGTHWQADRLLTAQLIPEGQSLQGISQDHNLNPKFLKTLIHSTLDALIYLQSRTPFVSHRELCPQNIWVTPTGQVSLVNFRIQGEKRPDETCPKVTAFVAPEILAASQPQQSSDLFSLGLTLIALTSQIQPKQIQQMRKTDGRFGFARFMPITYSLDFIRWLETLVQFNHSDRFPNAAAALRAFDPIIIERRPGLDIQTTPIVLTSRHLNDGLTYSLTIRNRIPDTQLEGKWHLTIEPPHPLAKPQKSSASQTQINPSQPLKNWISIEPRHFKSNDLNCRLFIDTHQLTANQLFRVTLTLSSNTEEPPISIPIEIKTAQFQWKPLPFLYMAWVAIAGLLGGTIATQFIGRYGLLGWGSLAMSVVLASMLGGAIRAGNTDAIIRYATFLTGIGMAYGTVMNGAPHVGEVGMTAYIVGAVWGIVLGFVVNLCQRKYRDRGGNTIVAWTMAGCVAIAGALWGIHITHSLPDQFALGELTMIGVELPNLSIPGLPQALLYGSTSAIGGFILVCLAREATRWIGYRQAEQGRLMGSPHRAHHPPSN